MNKNFSVKSRHVILVIFLLAIVIGVSLGASTKQSSPPDNSEASTEKTIKSSEPEEPVREETTEKLVQVYVDPKLYDPAVVTENDFVALYKEADQNSTVQEKLHRGEWTAYLGEEKNWIHVQTNKGKIGYISKEKSKIKEITRYKEPNQLQQLTVVLDAGHGGMDSGAVSNDETVMEKELTLKTALAVGEVLEKAGINVIYTRTEDTYLELSEITEFSLEKNPDLFLSFHYDNYDYANVMKGFTTYYYYDKMKKFAETVTQELAKESTLNNNGVREGNYYVIRETYIPSLLLELGYMNSDEDLQVITTEEYRQKVAQAILASVKKFADEDYLIWNVEKE